MNVLIVIVVFVVNSIFSLSVYPGAMGYGTPTCFGGSGRHLPTPSTTVYKVTTINPSGAGSLAECVAADGPRVCVFEVSGVIVLNENMKILNDYITIAGQTAPSPGIALQGINIAIRASHVLIQHIFIRLGDTPTSIGGTDRDCISSTSVSETEPTTNIVVDHVSMAFAIDETFTTWTWVQNVTLSYCIVSHALNDSIHSEGPHSKGVDIGPATTWTTMHHNLLAHNDQRNPVTGGGLASQEPVPSCSLFEVTNNYIYNYGYQPMMIHHDLAPNPNLQFIHVIKNIYKKGPNTRPGLDYNIVIHHTVLPESKVYIKDNRGFLRPTGTEDDWANVVTPGSDPADWRSETMLFETSIPSEKVGEPDEALKTLILENAGARPRDRDREDTQVIAEVLAGNGQIINCMVSDGTDRCKKNAGGYPEYAENTRTLTLPTDYNTVEENGYTRLENWLFSYSLELEKFQCFGKYNDASDVCGGVERGTCVQSDFCVCKGDFGGDECDSEEGNSNKIRTSLIFVVFLMVFIIML